MPFRSRLLAVAIGLTLLAAVGCGAFLSWDSFSRYQQDHAREQVDAAADEASAASQGPEACGAVMSDDGFFGWFTCIVEAVTADSGTKQAEYDLKAQQDMAAWAWGMLIITVWIAAITLFGVLFVAWTLAATRRMAIDAREIGQAQARAYISIDHFWLEQPISETDADGRVVVTEYPFRIRILNAGNSPAKNIQIKTSGHIDRNGFGETVRSVGDVGVGHHIVELPHLKETSIDSQSVDFGWSGFSIHITGRDVFGADIVDEELWVRDSGANKEYLKRHIDYRA